MKIKSKMFYSVFSISSVLALGLVVISNGDLGFVPDKAEAGGDGYSISFASDSNLLTGGTGSQNVLTLFDNPITFSYSGYSPLSDAWGSLAVGGTLANATALSGLTELSVVYGATTGNLTISYGWWDASSGSIAYEVTNGSITAASPTFNFDGYAPSFFKITASGAAQIASMTVKYSCEATEDPIPTVGNLTMTLSGSAYSVTNCKSSATSVVIPSSYKGLPVTAIGYSAFNACASLTSVTIPSSVTSIANQVLNYCASLTSISVDPGNPSYSSVEGLLLSKDGTVLIEAPGGLTSVSIPSSVTSIGAYALSHCAKLTSVIIPSSVTSIGASAFQTCAKLSSITIHNSVTIIGTGAFSSCSSLTSVTIPSSVTSIGANAFTDCAKLTSVSFDSPSSVTSIADRAFYNCASLTSVTIPNSVTSIGAYVFASCKSLTSVTIPSSFTAIGEGMFFGCTALTSVTIPSSVTSIATYAFYNCASLTSVTIPSSVTSLGEKAFGYCASLTSVTIPSSVTSIGAYAFADCAALASVTIPSSVTAIGAFAFYNCPNLSIACQAVSKPAGWDVNWNPSNYLVTWGV